MPLLAFGKASPKRSLPLHASTGKGPKIWIIMKLTAILLTIACLHAGAKTVAQKVTLQEKNVPLEKVFKEITRQTGYVFFYADGLLKKAGKVTVVTNNASVEQALNQCFSNLPLAWSIIDKTIVVKEKELSNRAGAVASTVEAAKIPITGKVTDVQGAPLSGASILEKGTNIRTLSKEDGTFTLNVSQANATIVISYVGYDPKEVSLAGKSQINIALVQANQNIDEVVIIAYQPVKKSDMLAASSSVTAKELKDNPLNNAAEVLQGKLAGVQISMTEGAPGADAVINIRGRGSITQGGDPLYVVDGVPMDNALSVLNPQDIESINVLKDAASTAIYGSRGANGVVVITTKGGRNTNGKTIIAYNMYYGVQKLAQKMDMMNPYDFVLYQYERAWWMNDTAGGTIKRYIRIPTNFDTIATYKNNPGFDWQERTMGRDALQSSHNVSVSGGNASTTYNLSVTANKQEGILINSDMERRNLNFKLDHKASSRFRFGFNTRYTEQLIRGAGTADAGGAGSNRLRQYTRYKPLTFPGEEEDSYDSKLDLENAGNGFNILNPILLANAETRRRYTNLLNINGYAQVTPVKNLSFRSTGAININRIRNKSFDDTLTNNAKSNNKQPLVFLSNSQQVQITNSNVLTYTNTSLYKTKHSINVLLGQEIQKTTNNTDIQDVRYFPVGTTADKAFNNLQLAAASTTAYVQPVPSSTEVPVTLASFFGTTDYNFDQRYFAKFTLRADGTSIFNEKNRWGYFPSGAVSWRISKEKFFPSIVINDLRLRASYGTAGNNRITPFSYRTLYTAPSNAGYGLNGALVGVFNPSNLGNDKLKWESQIAQNLGLDIGLWKNRVTVTVDAYANKSSNLLLNQTIPSSSGYTTQFQNIGETTNKGIETQISATIINTKAVTYSANFNISFNRNRITSLGPNLQILRNSGWFSSSNFPADYVLKVGEEVGAMYGYVNDGFYTLDDFDAVPFSNANFPGYTTQYTLKKGIATNATLLANTLQPGSPKYKDLNGDGKVDVDNDRTIIGHAQPRFFGGLSQTFSFMNFDLSVFANFVYGNDVFNANKLEYSSAYGSEVNLLNLDKGRWSMIDDKGKLLQRVVTVGTTATIVSTDSAALRAVNQDANIWFPSTSVNGFYSQSYAVEDGSYIRINNVTLGYNLPRSILSKVKMSNLRIYATVNNLATITNYTGYDPDASTRRSDPTTPGVDYAAYPRARTYVAGLNVTF